MTIVGQAPQAGSPTKTCDIVLKGGITSGVVYPLALVSLAKDYRFSSIGGTSAGAMAAAAAAAAEYGRQTGYAGFERLARIPQEVGANLLAMFQPAPTLKPVFDMFVATLAAKSTLGRASAIFGAAVKGYWGSALIGIVPGLVIAAIAATSGGGAGFILLGLLTALVGLVVAILLRLAKAATTDLADSDFGLCPGIRQPYASSEGFTDWLARVIDEAAGQAGKTDRPLTFGDLAAPPGGGAAVHLAMMTTSLMEKRPYTLPMDNHRFFFERSEWAKIFPERIMSFLIDACDPFQPPAGEPGEYFRFPDETRLPLVVAARMSLSFPVLISAVPLWCQDHTLTEEAETQKLRRCLFSDGGLSSNFPIHFFDHFLPNSPTFAITLDEYDAKRNRGRVWLPAGAGSGIQLPVLPFTGLGGFLMRLVDAAKDWQDNLQSTLPGYRERIVHVALDPDEGGLNLAMDAGTIATVAGYGEQAAEMLRTKFNLDEHRWRRFLVAMARMEETLDETATAYDGGPGVPESFADFLTRYSHGPAQYQQPPAVLPVMLKRGNDLAAAGRNWRAEPTIRDGHIPKPATNLRISPKP
jgi:predicted acylesterase/phospholipase RssA